MINLEKWEGEHSQKIQQGHLLNQNILVLVEPEIPYNTGNIARTCVLTGTALQLVRPLGFMLTEKRIRRAGMDYLPQLDLRIWDDLDSFSVYLEEKTRQGFQPLYVETEAQHSIAELSASAPQILIFGRESAGLPPALLAAHPERWYKIPMKNQERSLNLSNAAAIFLYEVLRQQGYPGLA